MTKEWYMNEALKQAEIAYQQGEVPIGAVVCYKGEIIGRGRNARESEKDPTAHAEMIAIREAAKNRGGWRLKDCELYVTVEPCPMCAGAIMLSRIKKVYIGTKDPKGGACGSLMNILQDSRLNHFVEIEENVLMEECQQIIKAFFTNLREERKPE